MAKFGFNPNEYEDNNFGETIPKGEYELYATESELKQTKAGTGSYISVTFEVVGPTNKGRKLWFNFNVQNPNSKAEDIGRAQLATWARACGLPNAQDTEELHFKPFIGKVGIQKDEQYGDSNTIDSWKPKGGATPAGAAPQKPAAGGVAKNKFDAVTSPTSDSTKPSEEPATPEKETEKPAPAPEPAAAPEPETTAAPPAAPTAGGRRKAPWE